MLARLFDYLTKQTIDEEINNKQGGGGGGGGDMAFQNSSFWARKSKYVLSRGRQKPQFR